jgi:hypothetical protein
MKEGERRRGVVPDEEEDPAGTLLYLRSSAVFYGGLFRGERARIEIRRAESAV